MVTTKNVCALPFIPGLNPRVILCRHRNEFDDFVYDGFGGLLTYSDTDPEAGQKSCSEYISKALDVIVPALNWTEIVTLRGEDWEVTFYFAIMEAFRKAKSQITDQIITREDSMGGLPLNTISSIRWLVPLAVDDNTMKPLGLSGISI